MKKIVLFCVFSFFTATLFAQQETYDLITFTPPEGWTKEEKQNVIVYTGVDNKNKTWCQIGFTKAQSAKETLKLICKANGMK